MSAIYKYILQVAASLLIISLAATTGSGTVFAAQESSKAGITFEEDDGIYTVTFHSNPRPEANEGNSTGSVTIPMPGGYVALSQFPNHILAGLLGTYEFDKWVTGNVIKVNGYVTGGVLFDENFLVNGDIDVYALWFIPAEPPEPPTVNPGPSVIPSEPPVASPGPPVTPSQPPVPVPSSVPPSPSEEPANPTPSLVPRPSGEPSPIPSVVPEPSDEPPVISPEPPTITEPSPGPPPASPAPGVSKEPPTITTPEETPGGGGGEPESPGPGPVDPGNPGGGGDGGESGGGDGGTGGGEPGEPGGGESGETGTTPPTIRQIGPDGNLIITNADTMGLNTNPNELGIDGRTSVGSLTEIPGEIPGGDIVITDADIEMSAATATGEGENFITIGDMQIPLVAPPNIKHWALLNLILSVLGVALAVGAYLRFRKQRKSEEELLDELDERRDEISVRALYTEEGFDRPDGEAALAELDEFEDEIKETKKFWPGFIAAVSVLAVIILLLTQDFTAIMAMVDSWTFAHLILFVAEIAGFAVMYKRTEEPEDYEPAPTEAHA